MVASSAVDLTCDCTSLKSALAAGGMSAAVEATPPRTSEKSGLLVSLPIERFSVSEERSVITTFRLTGCERIDHVFSWVTRTAHRWSTRSASWLAHRDTLPDAMDTHVSGADRQGVRVCAGLTLRPIPEAGNKVIVDH